MLSVIYHITYHKSVRKVYRPIAWLTVVFALTHSHLLHATDITSALSKIEDTKLRLCVEKIIKKKNWLQIDQVTNITCHNKGISHLEGLEAFSQLEKLSLHKNKLKDFNANLFPRLRILNLGRNKLKQLQIHTLSQLEELYIFNNTLTLLRLQDLTSLKKLKGNSNKIEQFEYQNLPILAKIYLFDNAMEDIDIDSLPSMKYMDVRQNPMPDELYERMDKMNGITILHDGNADDWN